MEDLKPGDVVEYVGASDEQVRWGGNDDPRPLLSLGAHYRVSDVEVHSWHTKVTLDRVQGRFNSVHFRPVGRGE